MNTIRWIAEYQGRVLAIMKKCCFIRGNSQNFTRLISSPAADKVKLKTWPCHDPPGCFQWSQMLYTLHICMWYVDQTCDSAIWNWKYWWANLRVFPPAHCHKLLIWYHSLQIIHNFTMMGSVMIKSTAAVLLYLWSLQWIKKALRLWKGCSKIASCLARILYLFLAFFTKKILSKRWWLIL